MTGDRTLRDERLKEKGIVNESYKSGADVKEVIDKYKARHKITYKKAA